METVALTDKTGCTLRALLIVGLAVVAAGALVFVPPIRQDPAYHAFADRRTIFGVPNFWNVVTNAAFLVTAVEALECLHVAAGVHHRRAARVAIRPRVIGSADPGGRGVGPLVALHGRPAVVCAGAVLSGWSRCR